MSAASEYSKAVASGVAQGVKATWKQGNSLVGVLSLAVTPLQARPAYIASQVMYNAVQAGTANVKAVAEQRRQAIASVTALPQAAAAAAGAQAQPGAIFIVPPVKTASGS